MSRGNGENVIDSKMGQFSHFSAIFSPSSRWGQNPFLGLFFPVKAFSPKKGLFHGKGPWPPQGQGMGPKQQLHSPRKQKKKGGGPGPGKGGGPRKEGVWKNSPFFRKPSPGTPLCTLRFFFFFPRRGCFWWFWGVFLGLLAPKLGFLGFWPLASGFSPGFWLCLASVCLSWLHPHSNADRNLCN